MPDRYTYTQAIQQQLDPVPDQDLFRQIWVNPTPRGGQRLTNQGLDWFLIKLRQDHWKFTIDAMILTPKNLLRLDRYLTCPYHLQRRRLEVILTIFGSEQAVVANLYGDIEQFISSLEA